MKAHPNVITPPTLIKEKNIVAAEVVPDRVCSKCGAPLHIKVGRYGKFIGCSNYPNCKFMEPLEKPKDTQVKCPVCGEGTMSQKKIPLW